MTTTSRREHWTAWVLALGAAAMLVRLLELGSPVQPVVMAAFVLIAPGAALVGAAPSWPWLLWATAVVASSLAIVMLVATALLYVGWWTPDLVLTVLLGATVLGGAGHRLRRGRVAR